MLGFGEALRDDVVEEKSQSLKLVPWISWDEWKLVRDSLLSSSPNSVASALQRVTTWRSRGCIPVAVEVTASIVEIQQKDPYFRDDLNESAMQSEDILAMLYCMAIMRLVNGVVEKTRKKNEISIGEAADAIGLPRMLIDIRHEGSHRDLPSLQLVRLASKKALDWLKLYYWEPQEKEIPIQTNQTVKLKKEIKRRLREVALCLKEKKKKSSSSHVETKCVKQTEYLFGRNKFLHPGAGKSSHSNYTGSKKQLTKSLKNVLRLYSSFSPEVVYALLECFLRALDSSNLAEHVDNSENGENKQTEYDDWKSVVLKLSRKEPEFLLTLTQAVLEKMESQEATNSEIDDSQSSENSSQHRRIELLSSLLEWLIEILKKSILDNKKEPAESKGSLAEKHLPALLRRCLLVSPPSNKHLMASALTLAQLTGNNTLLYKLRKLSLIGLSNSETNSVSSSSNETLLSLQEYSIRQAEEKFKLIRRRKMQSKKENQKDNEIETKSKWVVAKSWNPCPIGMLPHKIGFLGRLPVLDFADESREVAKLSAHEKQGDLNPSSKREAENVIEEFDTTSVKKVKGIEADCVSYDEVDTSLQGVKGHLMIDGVWRKVAEEELCGIVSAVRLLV
ncbi:hypothetical protein ACJIZ3_004271 [Penstemon smallii]|uniref:Uncharacterized protein n=1 Tax=Penstemon smallii TaxID=265156 RepID=A0ABD3S1S3_9LAMI